MTQINIYNFNCFPSTTWLPRKIFVKLSRTLTAIFQFYPGDLECVSLRKSKVGFLNPKESENGLCVSLLKRSIQDLSDHGASKEPKNPLWKWIFLFLIKLRWPKSKGMFDKLSLRFLSH